MTKRVVWGRWAQFVGDAVIGFFMFALVTGMIGTDLGARAEPQMAPAVYVAAGTADLAQGLVAGLTAPGAYGLTFSLLNSATSALGGLRADDGSTAMAILAIVFSLMFALNIGFWRHLRRTYSLQR